MAKIDAFSLVAKLTLDTSEYDEALGRASRQLPQVTEETERAEKSTNKLGTAFKVAGAAIGAAVSAAAAGASALVKQSVSSFANYEQLVGGVETLFSSLDGSVSSSATVLENAANAYKTAGISANQYMEQVTSFSAALVSSLGGDYQKAAEISDMAIRDMSDNANKMGTSMDAIQNAYQGFAKQNYTMLDNLKLGYGGTKTEMERLLADAKEFTGIDYDISSLSDVYEAIHVIQQQMGITGTTAKEAADTISGSFGSLGAAWQNLITGMANGNADLSELMGNVVDAATGTLNNIIPVAEQAVRGLGVVVEKAAPIITDTLPSLIDELLPPILETATSLVNSVTSALPSILGTVVDVIPGLITDISETLINSVPQLVGVAKDLVVGLAKGIGEAAPVLLKSAANAVKEVVTELTKPDSLKEILNAGLELVTGLAKGIGEALPVLADAAVDVVLNLVDFITDPDNLLSVVEAAGDIIFALGEGLIKAVPKLVSAVVQIPKKIIDGLFSNDWQETGGSIVENIAEGFISQQGLLSDAFGGALSIIDSLLGTNLNKWYNDVRNWSKNVGSEIYQALHAGEAELQQMHDEAFDLRYSMVNEYRDALEEYAEKGVSLTSSEIEQLWKSVYDKYITDARTEDLYNKYVTDIDYSLLYAWAKQAGQDIQDRRNSFIDKGIVIGSSVPSSVYEAQAAAVKKKIDERQQADDEIVTAIGEYTNLGVIEQIGKELTQEQKDAQSLAKEVWSASKEYAERQTKYLSLGYEDQIALWEKIKGQFIEGSAQYEDAEEKIFDIRAKAVEDAQKQTEKAVKEAEKLQKEQTTALEKQLKEQEKAREEYAKNVDKIYTEIGEIEKKYVDTLSSRTSEIYNSFGIFDEVPDRLLVSGIDLTNNLKDQIDTIQKFYTDLETLSARGVSGALVDEIRSMGVGALDQLDALLDLSASELAEYDDLVAQKRELAAGIAESELEGLREQTDSEIADKMTELESLSVETAENLGLNFAEGIAEGIASGTDAIVAATETAMKSASDVFGTNRVSNVTTVSTNSNENTNTAQNTATASRNGYNIVVNINGIQYQDITELAQAVSEEIQFTIERTEKGYAGA